MEDFICTKCNFKFQAIRISNCPYCGEDKVEKEKSADDLLEEVGNLLEKV